MTNQANLSAAIATMDRPASLERCLSGLLGGEMLPAEIVVVDQSRHDDSWWLIERRRESLIPIVYLRQERRGLAASRNTAVARSSCPVVAVTDDDCVPDRHWIAAIDSIMRGPSAPAAVTGRVMPLGPPSPGLYAVSSRTSTEAREYRGRALPWLVGTGANCSFSSEWYSRVGGYDERLGAGSPGLAGEDMDFTYRLLRAGARIRYAPQAIVYHERQSLNRRIATGFSYGYGMGAFCGIWLARRDGYPLRILGQAVLDRGRSLARDVRRGEWNMAYRQSGYLFGLVRGLAYGLRS